MGSSAMQQQKFTDGRFPVTYESRKLFDRVRNHTMKECLAIVSALQNFQISVLGDDYVVLPRNYPCYKQDLTNNETMRFSLALTLHFNGTEVVKWDGILSANCLTCFPV